jgi:hypothetical protein
MVGSVVPFIESGWSCGSKNHFPDLLIPIRTGSKALRSIADRTPPAEVQEISCSLDLPPQIMATRFFIE